MFEPTKYNESITPRALYCVFDNHHIYKLNDEIESLAQIVHNKIMKIAMGKKYDEPVEIFKKYPFMNFEAEEITKTIFIENLNDICKYVKENCKNAESKKNVFVLLI